MTITVTSYRQERILFCSDSYRYLMNLDVLAQALGGQFKFTHENFKETIVGCKLDSPKIRQISENVGLLCGGDLIYADPSILEGLNADNLAMQLEQRLLSFDKNKLGAAEVSQFADLTILSDKRKENRPTFQNFYVGEFSEDREVCILDYLCYKNGEIIRRDRYVEGEWWFTTFFADEMRDIFNKTYSQPFCREPIDVQVALVEKFFEEITKLYDGLAGGKPVFATIDKDGFQWI